MFKSRLDSLEFERENGYRHPPLYIIHYSDYSEAFRREEQAENFVKNTHVQC
jgi:hypothetical protein